MKKTIAGRIVIGFLAAAAFAVVAWAAEVYLSSGYIAGVAGTPEPTANGISWHTVSYGGGQRNAGGLVLEDCVSLFQSGGVVPAASTTVTETPVVHPYPNPFRPKDATARVRFPGVGPSARLWVYDVSGRQVVHIERAAVAGVFEWDGLDGSGRPLASGTYIYVLKDGGGQTHRGKLAIVR